MAKVNKYAAPCAYCGARVPPNGGSLWKEGRRWLVAHLDCADHGEARVIEYYSPTTGFRGTRNSRGVCEDAPCCGCCTF